MSNYYAPCFYGIDFVVIPSYTELSCTKFAKAVFTAEKVSVFGFILVRIFISPHILHSGKSVRIQIYSGPHFFHIFSHSDWIRRDTRIQSECGKIQTRITPKTDTFYAVKCKGETKRIVHNFLIIVIETIESFSFTLKKLKLTCFNDYHWSC